MRPKRSNPTIGRSAFSGVIRWTQRALTALCSLDLGSVPHLHHSAADTAPASLSTGSSAGRERSPVILRRKARRLLALAALPLFYWRCPPHPRLLATSTPRA